MPYPKTRVQIAWSAPPDAGSPTWTDITSTVRSCSVNRGRSSDFENFDTGTAQIVLDNRNRAYDPFNTAGPNYANLTPRKQIRIQASSTSITNLVPNPSFESNTTNWTMASGGTLARSNTFASVGSWSGQVTTTGTGSAELVTTPTNLIPATAGSVYVLQAALRTATGTRNMRLGINWLTAGGSVISTRYFSDTNIGPTFVSITGIETAPATTAFLQVIVDTQRSGGAIGNVAYVDAVIVTNTSFIPEYFDGNSAYSGWNGTTNNSTSYQDQYVDVFRGFVAGWPVTWTAAGYDSTVTVDCFDALGLIAANQLPATWVQQLRSGYGYYAWFPFDDQPNSTTARNANSINTTAVLSGTGGLQRADTLASGYPWDAKRPTATMNLVGSLAFTAVGSVVQTAVGAFIALVNPRPSSDETLFALGRFQVVNTATGLVVRVQEAGNTFSYNLGTTFQTFEPFQIRMVNASGTSGLYCVQINGQPVTIPAATTSAGGNGYGGQVTANVIIQDLWALGLDAPVASVAAYEAGALIDYGYAIANYRETTAARATLIAGQASDRSWNISTTTSGFAGQLNLGGNVLTEIQKVSDTEGGEVFVDKSGTIQVVERSYAASRTASGRTPVSFTDSGAGLSYGPTMEIRYDADTVRNSIVLGYSGGASVTVSNTTSINTIGTAEVSIDTYSANLDDATSLANFYLNTGAPLKPQVSALDVSTNQSLTDWASILGLELLDGIKVTRTPFTGSAFVQTMNLNRITHEITPDRWSTTLLGSARYAGWFVCDYSNLDGPDVLT